MDGPDNSVREDPNPPVTAGHRAGFYRLDANQSNASIFEDVEMAHDEVRKSLLFLWRQALVSATPANQP